MSDLYTKHVIQYGGIVRPFPKLENISKVSFDVYQEMYEVKISVKVTMVKDCGIDNMEITGIISPKQLHDNFIDILQKMDTPEATEWIAPMKEGYQTIAQHAATIRKEIEDQLKEDTAEFNRQLAEEAAAQEAKNISLFERFCRWLRSFGDPGF